jgi:putative addiction module CopG family antidote
MSIEIPPDLQAFVERELRTGRYGSEQDLVCEALRMLERERVEAVAGILAGWADVEAGRVQPLDEAFAELRRSLPSKGRS